MCGHVLSVCMCVHVLSVCMCVHVDGLALETEQ